MKKLYKLIQTRLMLGPHFQSQGERMELQLIDYVPETEVLNPIGDRINKLKERIHGKLPKDLEDLLSELFEMTKASEAPPAPYMMGTPMYAPSTVFSVTLKEYRELGDLRPGQIIEVELRNTQEVMKYLRKREKFLRRVQDCHASI